MKPVYKADDGETFESQEECERRNYFLAARRRLGEAFDAVKATAARELKTADGVFLSEPSHWSDFYVIEGEWGPSPSVGKVSISLRCITHIEVDDRGNLSIGYRVGFENPRQINLSELFAEKANAEKAVVEILRERIDDYQKQIDKMLAR